MFKSLWVSSSVSVMFLAAFSTSPTYQLQTYGVGSGGTNNATSLNYSLNATSGQLSGTSDNQNYDQVRTGLIQSQQANVPKPPSIDNGNNTYYNRLRISLQPTYNDNGDVIDGSDYTYSVAVSTNNFVTTNYVQVDGTIGTSPAYQSFPAWGGQFGSFVIGLSPSTTYQFAVNARQGQFSTTEYSSPESGTTARPGIVFSLTPNTVSMGNMLPGTIVSGDSNITLDFITNAVAGGSVYVAGTNAGLRSPTVNKTISAVNNDLTGVAEGFGIRGVSVIGPSSSLAFVSPFNGSSNTVGAHGTVLKQILSSSEPVGQTSELFTPVKSTVKLMGRAAATTPAANDYTETLTFIASANY